MKKQVTSTKKLIVTDWRMPAIDLVNNEAYTTFSKIKYISTRTNLTGGCLLVNKAILA